MAAPTCQAVAKQILRDWGILYLDPTSPANQTNPIRALDLETAALVITAALQEMAAASGKESKTQPGSAVLPAPTAVTLTATDGSTTISALTTYAAWMPGCTLRIDGDGKDNQLISQTKLARPFIGTTGSQTGMIYGDAVTLDETVGKVLSPMILDDGGIIEEAASEHEFITRGGYVMPGYYHAGYSGYPLWNMTLKPLETRPVIFFVDDYYDATLDYVPRRIRFSPMPAVRQSVGWTSRMNPQRVTSTDLDNMGHTDPGTKISCPNGWVESILLPIARKIGSGVPQFKNTDMLPEIERAYQMARRMLADSRGSVKAAKTRYW